MHLVYVDCSNLFIEAQKLAAVARGLARSPADATRQRVLDHGYRLDLHRLMALLRRAEGPTRAVAFGSITEANAAMWQHAEAAGFEVVATERGWGGKEKRVDTALVARMCRDAYRHGDPRRERITLVAGDGDYEPAVRMLAADGFHVGVLYWSHAGRRLREAASTFHALDPHLDDLALR